MGHFTKTKLKIVATNPVSRLVQVVELLEVCATRPCAISQKFKVLLNRFDASKN